MYITYRCIYKCIYGKSLKVENIEMQYTLNSALVRACKSIIYGYFRPVRAILQHNLHFQLAKQTRPQQQLHANGKSAEGER